MTVVFAALAYMQVKCAVGGGRATSSRQENLSCSTLWQVPGAGENFASKKDTVSKPDTLCPPLSTTGPRAGGAGVNGHVDEVVMLIGASGSGATLSKMRQKGSSTRKPFGLIGVI